MPATNSLVPATNLHPVDSFDIESQQTIQTAPHRYNKAVTFAKLGAMAGVCAATSGLLLADLANMHNISLPVQHTPGRELLQDLPVNGTCPEGQRIYSKERATRDGNALLAVFAGVTPGLLILSAGFSCLSGHGDGCCTTSTITLGMSALATVIGLPIACVTFVAAKNMEGDMCRPIPSPGGFAFKR